jgi:hypothetical protein
MHKAPSVVGRYAQCLHSPQMFSGAVTGVLFPAKTGVSPCQTPHQSVPGNLGNYGRAGNGETAIVAPNYTAVGNAERGELATVDKNFVRHHRQPANSATNGKNSGVEDVYSLYFLNGRGAYSNCNRPVKDELGQALAFGPRKFF